LRRDKMVRKVVFMLALLTSLLLVPLSTSAAPKHSDVFLMTNDYEVGLANQLLIIIQPFKGFKYNSNYPSTARIVKKPTKLKTYGLYEKEHFLIERDYIVVLIPFVPLAAGHEEVKIRLTYSLCSDTSCIVERARYTAEVEIHE
jgi:hypothetical protein